MTCQYVLPTRFALPRKSTKTHTGKLKGVTLNAAEEMQFRNHDGVSEVVLPRMPASLVIEVQSEEEGKPFLFDLSPEYVVWSRDGRGNGKVKRRGFRIIPDFAGTAHAYCGDTLDRCKGDLLEWYRKPTMEEMLRAPIIKSRVRCVENCLLVRPYSPALFRQGAAPGPQLLLQRKNDTIASQADLKAA